MEEGVLRETVTGTPQGGVSSPLLAKYLLARLGHGLGTQVAIRR